VIAGAFAASPAHPLITPAVAQAASVSADFRVALEPFGVWRHHGRFGDVWVPANRARDWRPYTAGHWIYTDDYGWYWVANDQEVEWGWITYHYGHWYRDPGSGWIWIPSDVWAPAWVDWRSGEQYVGWAPQPPDEVEIAVDDDPAYWSFVGSSDLIAPSIVAVMLPKTRIAEVFRRTHVVNRTVVMRGPDRHFAVNPGISSRYIANAFGRPIRSYQVRPRVLAGTAALPGAVQVRAEELRRRSGDGQSSRGDRFATGEIIQPSSTFIRPGRSVQPPQALARGEPGRLSGMSPRATRGLTVERHPAQGASKQPSAHSSPQQGLRIEPHRGEARAAPIASAQRRESTVTPQRGGRATARRPAALDRRPIDRGPIARAPTINHGSAQRSSVVSAPQRATRPPPAAIARPRPVVRATMAPRQAPARAVTSPPPRSVAAPPPVAPRAAAVAPTRPAAPMTTGTAPRGGSPKGPQLRPQ